MEETKEQFVRLPYFGLKKLMPFLKKYKKTIILMMFLGTLGSICDVVIPLFQQYALNNFVAKNTLNGVKYFVLLYILVIAFQVTVNSVSAYEACKVEMYVGRDMKRESFNHVQKLSFSYFNQNSVGYVHARIMSDTERIGNLVSWGLMETIWQVTYVIGAIYVMFSLNATLAALVLIIVPVIVFTASFFEKRLVKLGRKVREINSKITGNFNEGITGAKTAKTLVIEDRMDEDFKSDTLDMKSVSVHSARLRSMFTSIITFCSAVAVSLVLWRGGIITMEGVFTIGTLSVFMSYAQGLMEPIQWTVQTINNLITVQVNIERYTKLIETKSDVFDTDEVIAKYGDTFDPRKENFEELHGDIEFRDVSFTYPDGKDPVLEHFNLKVEKGTNVAIVGETGAGKSTLVNLVCRFFEPTEGAILIDGKDARERSQLWLHSNIGYVLQSPHLFSGTVLENLRYGNPDATMEQIEEAVKSVSADGIIRHMDKGYDSDVGEGGDLLSVGEKQLLSFARAILADPKIFILDEATSSVDTKTEMLIQNAIEKLMEGRTSFVIAHRLSTIRNADIILVVKDGKIIERGTHSELLSKKGYYYNLYTTQFETEQVNKILS